MIRQAIAKPDLGFQVVPGLSEASEADVGLLENGAPRTAYLVDNDDGGKTIRSKLKSAGISDDRIFSLGDDESSKFVLEDLIKKTVYLSAVNEELRRSHGETHSMADADIPDRLRPKAVEDWCRNRGINPPNKRAVAYRILDKKLNEVILEETHHEYLRKLYSDVLKTFSPSH